MHLTHEEPWGTTDIDLAKGHVLIRQDWKYSWRAQGGASAWTTEEKTAYHRTVDRLIWAYWSFRARLLVAPLTAPAPGTVAHELLRKFPNLGLTLSFDIRRVTIRPHWHATVTKVDPAYRPLPRAQANFSARTLILYSTDVIPHTALRYVGDRMARFGFFVTPHEFGHAMGYGYSRGNGEEYAPDHPCYDDVASVMNIGTAIRPRHLALVIETLGKIVPGCRFVAAVTP